MGMEEGLKGQHFYLPDVVVVVVVAVSDVAIVAVVAAIVALVLAVVARVVLLCFTNLDRSESVKVFFV